MVKKWDNIRVKSDTRNRLREDCKKEFIRNHPDFEHFNITDDFILNKVIDYYLEVN